MNLVSPALLHRHPLRRRFASQVYHRPTVAGAPTHQPFVPQGAGVDGSAAVGCARWRHRSAWRRSAKKPQVREPTRWSRALSWALLAVSSWASWWASQDSAVNPAAPAPTPGAAPAGCRLPAAASRVARTARGIVPLRPQRRRGRRSPRATRRRRSTRRCPGSSRRRTRRPESAHRPGPRSACRRARRARSRRTGSRSACRRRPGRAAIRRGRTRRSCLRRSRSECPAPKAPSRW